MTLSRLRMHRENPYSGRGRGMVCSRLSVIDIPFLLLESP